MSYEHSDYNAGLPGSLWVWVSHWWQCGGEGSRRRLKPWVELTEPELIRFRAVVAEIEEICALSQVDAKALPRSTRREK